MKRTALLSVAVFLLLLPIGSAQAGPITYYFSGTFNGAFGVLEPLENTPFVGQFDYDQAWAGPGDNLPAGAVRITTAFGTDVSTSGRLGVGGWGIDGQAMWYEPTFADPATLKRGSFVLGRIFDRYYNKSVYPADLSGWGWWQQGAFWMSSQASGAYEADTTVSCFSGVPGVCASTIPDDCSAFPGGGATKGCFPGSGHDGTFVPDPGSTLLLFGMGLVGLGAWRKRWQ